MSMMFNNGISFRTLGLPATPVQAAVTARVPMISPGVLGRVEQADVRAHAPRLVNYGSGYAPTAKGLRQIDARDVNAFSNPFARHNVPIGDAAFSGAAVTMPALDAANIYADPDALHVHPMLDPSIGAERMIDPKAGQTEGMWAMDISTILGGGAACGLLLALVAGISGMMRRVLPVDEVDQLIAKLKEAPDDAVLKAFRETTKTRQNITLFKQLLERKSWKTVDEALRYSSRQHNDDARNSLVELVIGQMDGAPDSTIAQAFITSKTIESGVSLFNGLLERGSWEETDKALAHASVNWNVEAKDHLAKKVLKWLGDAPVSTLGLAAVCSDSESDTETLFRELTKKEAWHAVDSVLDYARRKWNANSRNMLVGVILEGVEGLPSLTIEKAAYTSSFIETTVKLCEVLLSRGEAEALKRIAEYAHQHWNDQAQAAISPFGIRASFAAGRVQPVSAVAPVKKPGPPCEFCGGQTWQGEGKCGGCGAPVKRKAV
ncbi:MAG: hypothetical protein WC683_13205 [bacterium]